MIEEIGNAAGRVWAFLSENGESTLAQIKKKVGGSNDLLHQAIGWLAREDKIVIGKKGNSIKLSLK